MKNQNYETKEVKKQHVYHHFECEHDRSPTDILSLPSDLVGYVYGLYDICFPPLSDDSPLSQQTAMAATNDNPMETDSQNLVQTTSSVRPKEKFTSIYDSIKNKKRQRFRRQIHVAKSRLTKKTTKELVPKVIERNAAQKVPVCRICGLESVLTTSHTWNHAAVKPFSCSKCGYSVDPCGKYTLTTHIKVKCPGAAVIDARIQLYDHFLKALKQCYPKKYEIIINEGGCGQVQEEPEPSTSQQHAEKFEITCHYCDNTFSDQLVLLAHVERCHNTDRSFMCTFPGCPYVTKDRSGLKIHIALKHYQCSICQKKFLNSTLLNSHKMVHQTDRPFKCVQCGSAFKTKGTLVCHQRIHTGECPYICQQCGKAYRQLAGLQYHRAVQHKGIKPLKCRHCSERFYKGNSRKKHEQMVHV